MIKKNHIYVSYVAAVIFMWQERRPCIQRGQKPSLFKSIL